MDILIHATNSIDWHREYSLLLNRGYKKLGVRSAITQVDEVRPKEKDVYHVILGPNYWHKTAAACASDRLIVLNRCFVGLPTRDVAIGFGGFNGKMAWNIGKGDRWAQWPELAEAIVNAQEIKVGDPMDVLVLGDVYGSIAAPQGSSAVFSALVESYMRRHPSAKRFFKPHPSAGAWSPGPKWPASFDTVIADSTTAVVSYALTNHLVITTEKSIARSISGVTDVNTRVKWMKDLAWAQWHPGEILDGTALRVLHGHDSN